MFFQSAYHLNGIFGKTELFDKWYWTFRTPENGKGMSCTICESFYEWRKSQGTEKHGSQCFAWTT